MTPAYVATIKECLAHIESALVEAEAELPDDVKKEHYMAAKHGPNAWDAVYHAHFCQADTYPEMLIALLALRSLVEARTGLGCVLDEWELRHRTRGSLTLGKMRR